MKLVWSVLVVLILILQSRLWFGDGSFAHAYELQDKVDHQRAENKLLMARNQRLDAEVLDLKSGRDAIEERARHDLGMIGPNETFFMVFDKAAVQ